MPSLFIDTERLRELNSGLGQVCLHLGQELVRQRPPKWELTFLVPKGKTGIFGDNVTYLEASWLKKLWIPGQYDLSHSLHQDSAYVAQGSKLILTIHDLNFLERLDYSASKKAHKLAQLQRFVDKATALTAISNFTASQINEHLSITKPLRIITNGVAVNPADAPADLPANSVLRVLEQKPFFYFLALSIQKKMYTLLPMLEAFPDYRLVLAGPDSHSYAHHIREQAQKLGVADRLLMPGSVDELTKLWLYAHCDAFLFPSLSEGFGLPVAEAMAFGKPVFISRLTSLPEVGGKEAYYFDSFEPEQMAKTIDEGLRDFALNPLRSTRLQKRAAEFSWPNVAKQYWNLYQDVVSSRVKE